MFELRPLTPSGPSIWFFPTVLPDTFAEDKGATFTGVLEIRNGVFYLKADEVQMGCPSKYEPLEEEL